MNKKIYLLFLIIPFSPYLVLAQSSSEVYTLSSMIDKVLEIIFTPLVALLIGLGLLVFLWGLVKYIGSTDSEEDQQKARNIMIYGLIGLFAMVAVWGLVNLVVNTFFEDDNLVKPNPLELFP